MELMSAIVLLLGAFYSALTAHCLPNSFGKEFITAFPENIAYYHPTNPNNRVVITALYSNTFVTVTMKDPSFIETQQLSAGVPYDFLTTIGTELARSQFYNRTVHIESTNIISVVAVSQRGDSIQTFIVPPVESLSTLYYVPPIPNSNQSLIRLQNIPQNPLSGVVDSIINPNMNQPTIYVQSHLYRLIVINYNETNTVNVSGISGSNNSISLQPFELVQVWINRSQPEVYVLAENPVAVLFSHQCAPLTSCTCVFLVSPLYPVTEWASEYLVPSTENANTNETTFLLTTNQSVTLTGPPTVPLQLQYSQELPLNSSLVKTSSPVLLTLHRPGLLLNLIPTASFSSCYLIQTITNVQNNQALLVVPTDQTQGVKLGNGLLTLTWTPMIGTGYSWGLAYLQAYETSHIIWHSSSKMAVYYLGETTNSVFGNPAASLNTDPDSMGCVVKPALVELGTQQGGWPESIQYCQTLGYSLVSLNTEEMLLSVASKLRESGLQAPGQHQAWIGLRRSSLTGQWYWLSQQNVSFTHWAKNEPGTTTEGQCAMMFVDPDGNYTWSDQSCCEALPAVCYQGPTYLSLW